MNDAEQSEGEQQQEQDVQEQEQTERPESAAREAARYRTQLRTVEGERDALTAALTSIRQQMVEGATELQRPDALWAAGVNVDDLFGDDGRMDADKVKAAVAEQSERLGLARVRRFPRPDPTIGRGMSFDDDNAGDGWGGAIRAARGKS